MRTAVPNDESRLVELMAEFYAEAGFELDCEHAAAAFAALLADDRLGQVWLLERIRRRSVISFSHSATAWNTADRPGFSTTFSSAGHFVIAALRPPR